MKLKQRPQIPPALLEAECIRLVSSWLALRRRNYCELGERAARELLRDVEADVGETLANAPSFGQRELDKPPSCYGRYIEFADQYGVSEWPVRKLAHQLMDKSDLKSFEDAQQFAARSWDEALETYESHHARLRRRSGTFSVTLKQPTDARLAGRGR
jgi:hypothetical protein